KTLDYEQTRDSQEISEANRRTSAKYGEGSKNRSRGTGPDSRDLEGHTPQPNGPGQLPRRNGGRAQEEANPLGQTGTKDDNYGGYDSETGEATAENEEITDDHLLHGDRTAPGLHHGLGLKGLGIDIVPEEDSDRRRRKRRR